MRHGCCNGAATRDQQHMTRVLLANVLKGTRHALHKVYVAGHALGRDDARHPLREPIAQQAKVLFVAFGRCGLDPFTRMNGANEGVAVVLVEPWPHHGVVLCAHAVLNSR